jgi:hybrid cluster-associated redox disulfide protein
MDIDTKPDLDASMTVADVLAYNPRTASVFLRRGMACVGCAIAPFDTLADVATIHKMSIGELLTELRAARMEGGTP